MLLFNGQRVIDTRAAGDPQRIGLLLEAATGTRRWVEVWRSEYRDGRLRLKTNLKPNPIQQGGAG